VRRETIALICILKRFYNIKYDKIINNNNTRIFLIIHANQIECGFFIFLSK